MRAALLLLTLALALAACGDDTSITPGPDLSFSCPSSHLDPPAHDCCARGVVASQPCTVVGDYCSAFELRCTCGADLVWSCRNPALSDMVRPLD